MVVVVLVVVVVDPGSDPPVLIEGRWQCSCTASREAICISCTGALMQVGPVPVRASSFSDIPLSHHLVFFLLVIPCHPCTSCTFARYPVPALYFLYFCSSSRSSHVLLALLLIILCQPCTSLTFARHLLPALYFLSLCFSLKTNHCVIVELAVPTQYV